MQQSRGFSLIELLVVITIMSVMMGAGVFAYSRIQADKGLSTGVKTVRSLLYTARQEALMGKYGGGCIGNFKGKKFNVVGGSKIEIYSICGSGATETSYLEQTHVLSPGVTINPTDQNVQFTSVKMGVSDPEVDVFFNVNYAGSCVAVTVTYPAGEIEQRDCP